MAQGLIKGNNNVGADAEHHLVDTDDQLRVINASAGGAHTCYIFKHIHFMIMNIINPINQYKFNCIGLDADGQSSVPISHTQGILKVSAG